MHFTPTERSKPIQAIAAQSITSATDTNGTEVDTNGWDGGYMQVIVNAGTFTGASPAMDIDVQESDTSGSGYADVTGASFAQITTANDAAIFVGYVRLRARERYLRVQATSSGTITAIPISVTCVLLNPSESNLQDVSYSFEV